MHQGVGAHAARLVVSHYKELAEEQLILLCALGMEYTMEF